MNQPLGTWSGHAAEVRESQELLAGEGATDLVEVTFALARELASLLGRDFARPELEAAIASGAARDRFLQWAAAQGADPEWLAAPTFPLAPEEVVLEAARDGILAAVDTRGLGLLLSQAARGEAGGAIDPGVSLRCHARLGQPVAAGEELCRIYLPRPDEVLTAAFHDCFTVGDAGEAPPLLAGRVAG
jgi:thymidine phosphorylase